MSYLSEYALFLAKTITLVFALGYLLALIAKARQKESGQLNLSNKSQQLEEAIDELQKEIYPKDEYKKARKQAKKQHKQTKAHRCFVIDFEGDIRAQQVTALRQTITALLMVANEQDEVLIRLESGGGMMHAYGLAASQLARLHEKNIPLTIAVDKIAASGGYLMASVANKIIAAPFAIIGSIGVLAQTPNFNRWLKKHDIDYEMITAGKYKRTLSIFGENTKEGRQKFQEEIEIAHQLFKGFITEYRPQLDVEHIATGEYWHASNALQKGLIDALQTSDDYLLKAHETRQVFQLSMHAKPKLVDKLTQCVQGLKNQFVANPLQQ